MRLFKDDFELNKEKIDLSNVKKLREKKGYSQVKLGQLVGVTNSTIQGMEQTKKDKHGKDTNFLSEFHLYQLLIDWLKF